MKNRFLFAPLFALFSLPAAAAADFKLSGVFDSKLTGVWGAGGSGTFLSGLEEFANIRIQTDSGGPVTFYGAFNAIAASGISAEAARVSGGFSFGENYAAEIELERLYFRANFDAFDIEAGLKRVALGFGQVFAPTDFLNPHNPLFPDARPRAALAADVSWYPSDGAKLRGFAVSPESPLSADGGGALFGASVERQWEKAGVQAFYVYQIPDSDDGTHRAGFSAKADVVIGIWADALFEWNASRAADEKGLLFSAGADYSFFSGKCYVLAEYLYSGDSVSRKEFSLRNYIYALAQYSFNDYTKGSVACLASVDDGSFMPVISLDYDIFQGFTLSASVQLPWAQGPQDEFSPERSGRTVTLKTRLRF